MKCSEQHASFMLKKHFLNRSSSNHDRNIFLTSLTFRLPFQGLDEIQADLRNAADKCACLCCFKDVRCPSPGVASLRSGESCRELSTRFQPKTHPPKRGLRSLSKGCHLSPPAKIDDFLTNSSPKKLQCRLDKIAVDRPTFQCCICFFDTQAIEHTTHYVLDLSCWLLRY